MEGDRHIRVVIVDDHELLRGGIRFALLAAPDIVVVGEAHHGEDAMRVCLETQPDVVLMDMRLLGDMDGVAATHAVRALCPTTQVVGLSGYTDPDTVRRVMQAGAIGYIAKGASAATLVEAIRNAARGQPTLSSELLAALLQPPEEPRPQVDPALTLREREVLQLVAQGKTNAQIAETLVVSVAAVKYHVGNILSKLGLANRTEAASYARDHGLAGTLPFSG